MEPIDYQIALHFFNNRPSMQMPTLGGKSLITVDVLNHKIRITNSGNNQMLITVEHWNRVCSRMNVLNLHDRRMASRYARGNQDYNWHDSPCRIFSPYVPAVMKYIQLHQNI